MIKQDKVNARNELKKLKELKLELRRMQSALKWEELKLELRRLQIELDNL